MDTKQKLQTAFRMIAIATEIEPISMGELIARYFPDGDEAVGDLSRFAGLEAAETLDGAPTHQIAGTAFLTGLPVGMAYNAMEG